MYNKKRNKKGDNKFAVRKAIKNTLIESFELPEEIIYNLPLITVVGNRQVKIENFKSILEYSSERIKIKTEGCIVNIEGERLNISYLCKEIMSIKGKISKIYY